MATIVDSLLVTLGLDDKQYRKGAEDASRSQKKFKDDAKKRNEEIADSLKGVTRQIAAMVIGFESLRGAVGFLAGINNSDAALGRLAANTGTSVHQLNQWGNAVELAGGDAKEAQNDVAGLANAITRMQAYGEDSPILTMLRNLQVSLTDAAGKSRNLFDVIQEAGTKLRDGPYSRAQAFTIGRGGGLSEGTLNLLLTEEQARRRIFEAAERQNNLDEAAAKRAQKMQEQWRELKQGAIEFGRAINDLLFPAIMSFFKALEPIKPLLLDIVKSLKDSGAFEGLAKGITHAAEGLKLAVDGWKELIALMPAASTKAADAAEVVTDYFGKNSTDPVIRALHSVFGSATPQPAAPALPGTERSPISLARIAQQQRTSAYQQRQSGSNVVQIDHMEIHTRATDADGIAAGMQDAISRKVGQADSGMN